MTALIPSKSKISVSKIILLLILPFAGNAFYHEYLALFVPGQDGMRHLTIFFYLLGIMLALLGIGSARGRKEIGQPAKMIDNLILISAIVLIWLAAYLSRF